MQRDYSAKSVFWYLINLGIVVVVVFGMVGIGTLIRYSNAIAPSRTIDVIGEGIVDIVPDMAIITASTVTRGPDASKVQQESTQKMNSIVAFVKSQGIKDADIKTTGFNLYPTNRWDPDTGAQIPTGYEATQTITIKVRGIDKGKEKVTAIAGGLVPAGANQLGGVQYQFENPDAQYAAARQKAFDNAFQKAASMARQNGVRIARVITFSESSNYGGPILYYDKVAAAPMGRGGDGASPSIEPGTEEVRITVNVKYEIR